MYACRQFGSIPLFWLPVILSTFVSLLCLIMAYPRLCFLYKEKFHSRQILWAFWLTPAFIFPIISVVSNFLDQVWRINW
jgi:ABC-type spermidine/putrescine transport system permease subunit I